ncbi:MAG: RNA-binding protein [Oscillospiraceae bacterium]|nr:RNA-binding protein [Oscillospiraceae bacterium]
MDRKNIDKIAKTEDDRLLLARIWDKINAGIHKYRLASSGFLSPREQEMAQFLFGNVGGLHFWGGYDAAQRKCLIYLPDYLYDIPEDDPIVCLRATYYAGDELSHRDFLGALMGFGVDRQCVGDICVQEGFCDFFVTREISDHLLREFTDVGRTKVKLQILPIEEFLPPEEKTETISDTLPSLRLDCVIASGFRISRSRAGEFIAAGQAAIDGLPCEKSDRAIAEGMTVSVRGLGKIRLSEIGNRSKKDRIFVKIEKFM